MDSTPPGIVNVLFCAFRHWPEQIAARMNKTV